MEQFENVFIVVASIIMWLLLGLAGWVLTIENTKNKEWLNKIETDNKFRNESKLFHIIFGLFSFLHGVIHSI